MEGLSESTRPIVSAEQDLGKKPGTAPAATSRATRLTSKHLRRIVLILAVLAAMVVVSGLLLRSARLGPADSVDSLLQEITAGQRFDLFTWEVEAILGKARDFVDNPIASLTPEEQQEMVREYLQLARRAGELERDIEGVYSAPLLPDPDQATEGRRRELAVLREQLAQRGPAVEAVLEGQLAQQIAALGLARPDIVWPPPRLRFTEPPQLLVVSPRDRIERTGSVDLLPDLEVDARSQMEEAVGEQANLSGYVTGIGGYGAWPTMVVNRFGLPWTMETIAHEWVHNYLAFHPLGWSYLVGGDSITINETVASIVGEELGRAVMEAYYPDLIPPPPRPPSEIPEVVDPAEEPRPFDFGREMRATRVVVDALLAHGFVEEAEGFMEARRRTFVEHGYDLRVLNQAYFAFHGSYATGPAATDPIGPKLLRLRELSPSLRDFLKLVDGMTSEADIDAALAELEATAS